MNYLEILEVLKNQTNVESFAFSGGSVNYLGLGMVKEVDQYGGEGQGDTWYSIKHFADHDVYIRIDGWYQSYNGTEFHGGWDSCREVKPIEKVVTVYE